MFFGTLEIMDDIYAAMPLLKFLLLLGVKLALFITLIAEVGNPFLRNQLRLISLSKITNKIFSKLVANSLVLTSVLHLFRILKNIGFTCSSA